MHKTNIAIPKIVVQALEMAKLDVEHWLKTQIYELANDFELKLIDKNFVAKGLECLGEGYLYELSVLKKDASIDIQLFVSTKVWSFMRSLTDREIEVLKKRVEEKKSLTKTASEMSITPQGVVAFMRSIKAKVSLNLLG